MTPNHIVVYTTFPNKRTAKRIINGLVKARIAACGNVFELLSIYRWRGKVEKTPEYGALIKTKKSQYCAVEKYLKDNHPYEVPEIIAWPIEQGQKTYLNWIDEAID